ncbi:RNA polymerase sigma factor [soil metagenome]
MSNPGPDDGSTAPPKDLLETYLDQREPMIRFFRGRMGPGADVEDLLQELYLKIAGLDPDHVDIQSPRAYLYRLASNLLVDRWRAWQRSRARDSAWRLVTRAPGIADDMDDAPSPEAIVVDRDRLEQLARVIATLPTRTRTIFRLHKFEGLSHAEVAERLGVSRSAVEKHMMDALRALAEKMEP